MNNLLKAFFFIIKNLFNFYFKKNNILLNKYSLNFDELNENGITIIKNYYTQNECTELIKEMQNIFKIKKNDVLITESLDHRLWGFEEFSQKTDKFLNDININNLIKKYESRNKILQSTSLAGNIKYKENGKGSGSGWHRDRTFYKYRFSKAMIYLNDVCQENGPFQYLEKSHKIRNIVRFNHVLKKNYSEKWFHNDEINLASIKLNMKIRTITASAGDLIIFDGTGVHRGKPLLSGERFALTNYYRFDPKEIFTFKNLNYDSKKNN